MESIKIALGCILAAVLYGIVHDQFTARICIEYFTVFHPPVFATQSPTLLALGWGIIATWWAGAIIGVLLVIASRFGSRPRATAKALVPLILGLMLAMAVAAVLFGCIGYFWAPVPSNFAFAIPAGMQRRFLADLWAHNASYASGFLGGLILCAVVWLRRGHSSNPLFQ